MENGRREKKMWEGKLKKKWKDKRREDWWIL